MVRKLSFFVTILAVLVLAVLPAANAQDDGKVRWPTAGWETSSPEQQGIRSEDVTALIQGWDAQGATLDSFAVIRHGVLVAEGYAPPFTLEGRHELHSASKSVAGALVGIAAGEGLLGLDDPVLGFFPDKTFQNVDANKEKLSVRNLLMMSSGFDCGDLIGGTFTTRMVETEDWVQWALDQPLIYEPGTKFDYCNADVFLLSAILSQVTGMSAWEYAQEKLFAPLGITDTYWASSPDGISNGMNGLQLTTHDFAKFGYLFLHEGLWDGQQVVPADFAREALTGLIDTGWPDFWYGYLWWVNVSTGITMALGWESQIAFLVPASDLVVVVTESGYPEAPRAMTQSYGFTYQIAGLAVSADPLPENTAAFDALQTALNVFSSPAPVATIPLPAMAEQITDKVYGMLSPLDFNLGLDARLFKTKWEAKTVTFLFASDNEAAMSIVWANDETWNVTMTLDDVYQVADSPLGKVGIKGLWITPDTFRVWIKQIGSGTAQRFDFWFNPPIVQVTAVEVVGGVASVAAGMQQ